MAAAAAHAADPADPAAPLLLVPVPSRPGSRRRRGHDPLGAIVRHAVRRLRRAGLEVTRADLLRSSRGVLDQAGLCADDRAHNLAGSMSCPASGLVRLRRRHARVHVVVCDDVLTTGSTALEAQRALTAVGLRPLAIAAVAATRRRHLLSGTRKG